MRITIFCCPVSSAENLSLTHSFSVTSENITINDTLPKRSFLNYIFPQKYVSNFNQQPPSTELSQIMQNDGHSRSFNVTNFGINGKPVCDFLTYFVSYTVFKISLWRIIGPSFAVDKGGVHVLNALVGCERLNSELRKLTSRNWKHLSIVWCRKYFEIWNRSGVTHECDRQTDRQTRT